MIIAKQARQAPVRPESTPKGERINQLTGKLPHHYPEIQAFGDFTVELLPEPEHEPRFHPVPAPFAQSPNPEVLVEEVAETNQPERPEARTKVKNTARGESHGRAKLSAGEVQQIRLLAEGDEWSISAMARSFGVSRAAIRKIIRRDTWRDDMWVATRYEGPRYGG